jgi:hypothetical protein
MGYAIRLAFDFYGRKMDGLPVAVLMGAES